MPQLIHSPSNQVVQVTQTDHETGWQIAISDSGSGGSSGGKSGGKNGASVTEAGNTIRSKAYINLLFAISEGEVNSWADADPLKCIYLDETPIKNTDGSLNFKDVLLDFRTGTQDQTHINGVMPDVQREINVGVQVKKVNPAVTRTITDPNLNAVRLRFMFPAMREVSEDGKKISGSRVEFSIKLNGVEVQRPVVQEKATSPFEVANFYIPLSGAAPWNLSVERITADSTTERVTNDMFWQGYTEIIEAKLRYPNTCLLFVQADSEQFSSIPKLSVKLYGIRCLIPHNYNPFNRTYSGMFNGSLVPGWTNNPSWILYDLITSSRYGLGDRIPRSLIDVSTFYSAAQYCDDLVPDGFGKLEPRFTFNAYITSEDDAMRLLESVCAVMRSMPYSSGGSIFLTQDKPRAITKIFSPSNVISEDEQGNPLPPFTYSASDLNVRHTAAYVSWSNPSMFYKDDQVFYENVAATKKYGFNKLDARGLGITSRGQAYRYAKWLVETAQNLTNTVTFKVGSEGELVNIGECFAIADPLKQQQRFYGRLKGGNSTTKLNLDQEISLNQNDNSYTIILWNPNTNLSETRRILMPQTESKSISVEAFTWIPDEDSVFIIQNNQFKPKPFQCVSVVENGHQFEITGLEYYDSIYDSVDRDTTFIQPNYNGFPNIKDPVKPPTNLTLIETLYQAIGSAGVKARLEIGWSPSTSPWIRSYLLQYKKRTDLAYISIPITTGTTWTLDDIEPAEYDFQVTAINGLGVSSQPLVGRKVVLGLSAPPSPPTNLRATYYENYILLTWDTHPDLDVRIGGVFKIKQTSKTLATNWTDGTEILTVAGNQNSAQLPLIDGSFLIKAIDSSGVQSLTHATFVARDLPELNTFTSYLSIQESPAFNGQKAGTTVSGGLLKLAVGSLFDSTPGLFDSGTGLFDSGGGSGGTALAPEGFYYFSQDVDLGAAYSVRILADISALVANENILFDLTPGLFDSRQGLFDGENLDKAVSNLQISVSVDGSTFSDWQNFVVGDYLGWKFKFRMRLQSFDQAQNAIVQNLGVRINLPERVESAVSLSSASAITNVSFSKSFRFVPQVSVTIQNAQSGDYIEAVTPTTSGFAVSVKNSSGVFVARSVSYLARGFGRGV